ncbi:hypothetical protein [Chryseobacterium sp. SL1]|uniref:hypothetical protein n=1 Tax=Chryseobacterium sp. SL1 TaxID=2995159 RepID=UPI002275DE11|nr:hypothetical protein [Chryseobacterium sp. SL1]MCY1660404.1 hypothetical protein [Chryseobacterium sp. SL1]
MGLLDFWRKKKTDEPLKSSFQNKIKTPEKNMRSDVGRINNQREVVKEIPEDPVLKYQRLTAIHYRSGDFDKANENAEKTLALGGSINSTVLDVIKAKIDDRDSDDCQSFEEKSEIISTAITEKKYIEFIYPSETNSFFVTVSKVVPQEIKNKTIAIKGDDKIYNIDYMKKIRSFTTNYHSEKPI